MEESETVSLVLKVTRANREQQTLFLFQCFALPDMNTVTKKFCYQSFRGTL